MSKVQDCDDLSCSLGFVNPDAEAEKEMTILMKENGVEVDFQKEI